jgi:hypothetical protein
MKRANFGGSQFPDEEDRDGPQNFSVLNAQPSDMIAIHRKCYQRIFYFKGTQN